MFLDTIETLKKGEALLFSNPLSFLNPFLETDGLLRVGGRLSQSQNDYQSRHPFTLHGKHHLTFYLLIIKGEHKQTFVFTLVLTLAMSFLRVYETRNHFKVKSEFAGACS